MYSIAETKEHQQTCEKYLFADRLLVEIPLGADPGIIHRGVQTLSSMLKLFYG